jgi:anti-anti-sigma factor
MSASVRNPAPPLSLDVVLTPSAAVCAVSGEVDLSTAPELRDRLLAQVSPAGPDVVVDLVEVSFFGAAGLSVLVEVQAAADACGVGFYVVARTRAVLVPLTVTGLDRVLDVHPDVAGVQARARSAVRAGARIRRQARPARSLVFPRPDVP